MVIDASEQELASRKKVNRPNCLTFRNDAREKLIFGIGLVLIDGSLRLHLILGAKGSVRDSGCG